MLGLVLAEAKPVPKTFLRIQAIPFVVASQRD
jgi:hypothetical protein